MKKIIIDQNEIEEQETIENYEFPYLYDLTDDEEIFQEHLRRNAKYGRLFFDSLGTCFGFLLVATLLYILIKIIFYVMEPDRYDFYMNLFFLDNIKVGSIGLCIAYTIVCLFITSGPYNEDKKKLYDPLCCFLSLNPSVQRYVRLFEILFIVVGFCISYIQGFFYPAIYGDSFVLNIIFDLVANLPCFFIAFGVCLSCIGDEPFKTKKEFQINKLNAIVNNGYSRKRIRTKIICERTYSELQASAAAASTNAQKGDAGEKAVNYKLRWWEESKKARDPSYHVLSIQYDCQSQYSNACIRLAAPHVAQGEPQEFDHLLVTSAGVIAIETKTYSGTIEVVGEGTWKLNGQFITSPNSQVERHHVVLFNILKKFQVPIHSVICIADPNSVIVGATNSSIPIVSIRDLESYLNSIQIHTKIPEDTLWQIFRTINNAKVGRTA